ncbi:MAG: ATP-binding protein [Proteobacteria bacterium]|nr:ATP-binding protein [Pseudomonadota bacterium]
MRLDFLNREPELRRLERVLGSTEGALVCVYGRRRVGKSRLVRRALEGRRSAYFVGDDRDSPLHVAGVAEEIAGVLPGFEEVRYPDWQSLLQRFVREAPVGTCLCLDEFPALVRASPELPSLLQKLLDGLGGSGPKFLVCGSSQRMMHGLVLDASAPLYGRAREVLRIEPLDVSWLQRAFGLASPAEAVSQWAVWGGVPRYWELALDYASSQDAQEELLLDPQGPLHREPQRLLLDDMSDIARAASLLALVGGGSGRVSELAARLGVPATSLARTLANLIDLGFLARELPFGRSLRDTKRTYYRLADPLLRYYFRFVEPNRSRLAAGQTPQVMQSIQRAWPQFLGAAWEDLARQSVARDCIHGTTWNPASRWWGRAHDRTEIELDVVAQASGEPSRALVGEVKLTCSAREARGALGELEAKARRCPDLSGRRIEPVLWVLKRRGRIDDPRVLGPDAVLRAFAESAA